MSRDLSVCVRGSPWRTPPQVLLGACSVPLDTLRWEPRVSFEQVSRTITPNNINLQAASGSY